MITRIHFELGHNLHLTEDIGRLEGEGNFIHARPNKRSEITKTK